jgi:small subunit ribosomal protein S2
MAEENLLIPTTTYLKSGIHIGTKFKTKYMEKFIYKTRTDGLSVLNLQKIDERIQIVSRFLSKYEPEDILVVSRRENGWKPLKALNRFTGIKIVTGRYPPGMMTNTNLETFIEPKILLIIDAWPDRNAMMDANKIGIPVIALCDTNNQPNFVDLVMPCNNKGKKSLGIIFHIIATQYLRLRGKLTSGQEIDASIEDFTEK